ncbi:acid sphingomyelinase [Drechmeria coniospora]|uniref:Sphingomyelin phosphodiesterase n=1 Tax=Drechmeria coniospora TaxID=98403 RepID=A0A151GWQ7_DRECN|nr:acid sphingomyelinase [Drechmeria coniospora]KYK61510.1 acid sphingomyelinase [Drechmeria coniospora]
MRPQSLFPLLALGNIAHGAATGDVSPGGLALTRRELEARGFVDDIWKKIKNVASCAGCEGVLGLFKGLTWLGDGAFVRVTQTICKLAKVQDADVCEGAIALEGPVIANVIRNLKIGSKTSKTFCTTLFGLCGFPDVAPWSVPFPSVKPSRSRPKSGGKPPIKIVHYSDIHIDPLYVAGASADCSKPICCRPYTPADAPGKSKSPAGPNGDHKCDVPFSLEKSMYRAINKVAPDAAFAIFTGDIVDHAVWKTSQTSNAQIIDHAYTTMNDSLKLVYGTVGNHEQHPVDAIQPISVGNNANWLYGLLSSKWQSWIGKPSTASAESMGAYSTKYPKGNLRVISLNTNLYYQRNYWLYRNMEDKDPNSQIAWLVRELDAAEKAGENVYIIGHMPLGDKDALPDPSNYLDQILKRYSSIISAMFFGHTHVDHFEISYTDYAARTAENAYLTSYIAPSLTPTSGMPSFRVYEVDPDTFAVRDVITYIADMKNPAFQTTGPVWAKFYSAKEAYGKAVDPPVTDPEAELTPAFWHRVTEAFEKDASLFDAYMARKSRGWNVAKCTGDCKAAELCQLRAGRAQNNCFVPQPGFHFSKRSEVAHEHGEHDECGVPVTMKALSALTDSKEMLQKFQELIEEERARAEKLGEQPKL